MSVRCQSNGEEGKMYHSGTSLLDITKTVLYRLFTNSIIWKHLRLTWDPPSPTCLLFASYLLSLCFPLTSNPIQHKRCDRLIVALLQCSGPMNGAWEVAVHCTIHNATNIITVYKVASLHWLSPRFDSVPNCSLFHLITLLKYLI
jgi:hypothetical protein